MSNNNQKITVRLKLVIFFFFFQKVCGVRRICVKDYQRILFFFDQIKC